MLIMSEQDYANLGHRLEWLAVSGIGCSLTVSAGEYVAKAELVKVRCGVGPTASQAVAALIVNLKAGGFVDEL